MIKFYLTFLYQMANRSTLCFIFKHTGFISKRSTPKITPYSRFRVKKAVLARKLLY